MEIIKAGVDAGNYSLKLITANNKPIIIPTVYSLHLGETTELIDMDDIPNSELENNLDVTINSKALRQNGVRMLVGQKVLDDRLQATELEKKSDKSKDEIPAIVTLCGLAVDAMMRNEDKSKIKVTYDLAVALPIGTITKESAQQNAVRYIGTHEVIYHHPSGRDVVVEIIVDYAKTLPEGAAAAWGLVYDETGSLITRKVETNTGIEKVTFDEKVLLHFDIGAGTTEIVVSKGVQFNPRLSEGVNFGVKDTILDVIKIWNRNNPRRTVDSLAEFNDIFLNSEHPRHNEIREVAQTGLMQLANRIGQEIINKIDDMKDVPHVYIYGGGAAILKEYLSKVLMNKDRIKNVVFVSDPVNVNARGLLVYAMSPRYEQMKTAAQAAPSIE